MGFSARFRSNAAKGYADWYFHVGFFARVRAMQPETVTISIFHFIYRGLGVHSGITWLLRHSFTNSSNTVKLPTLSWPTKIYAEDMFFHERQKVIYNKSWKNARHFHSQCCLKLTKYVYVTCLRTLHETRAVRYTCSKASGVSAKVCRQRKITGKKHCGWLESEDF